MLESQEELFAGRNKDLLPDTSRKGGDENEQAHEYIDKLYSQTKRQNAFSSEDSSMKCPEEPGVDIPPEEAASSTAGTTKSHMNEDMLQSQAQTLIDEVNKKRQRDTESIENYKTCQLQQVEKFCIQIENHLFETYKVQNKAVDDKIQQLFATLERIAKIRAELEQFREVLDNLYKEMMP